MEIKNIKKEFPIFKQKINGKPLVYLDSANSSQKPKVVIDKISNFYETEFSNVGRSVHTLAVKATNSFEDSRDKVKDYINGILGINKYHAVFNDFIKDNAKYIEVFLEYKPT